MSAEYAKGVPSPLQSTRFIGRQPILNAQRSVIGYELLFRSSSENLSSEQSGNSTLQTLDRCISMGVETLVGPGLAFVNCTREALVKKLVTVLPARKTVLEILETVVPDDELVHACWSLKNLGYRFALDDFEPHPRMMPLIELASYVKVDFRVADSALREFIHEMVRGKPISLLAEKIENEQEFRTALAEGYEFFQGYFFCRPAILSTREIPSNSGNYLELLAELSNMPLNISKVRKIVESEASLCYRLLRLANSASMGLSREVTSVRSAIMLVGEDRFRTLVSIAVSSALGRKDTPVLTSLTLERARFCELLAPLLRENPTEQYILGLLSTLDAILERPMEVLLRLLPLRQEAKEALLGSTTRVALPLNLMKRLEEGSWEEYADTLAAFGISEQQIDDIHIEAIQWAADAMVSSSAD